MTSRRAIVRGVLGVVGVGAGVGVGVPTLSGLLAGCGKGVTGPRPIAGDRAEPQREIACPVAPLFSISLAQWSFHRALYAGTMDHLDFAPTARGLGIDAVEYVNVFFKDKATDAGYLREMKSRADAAGVRSLLIMCDGEGAIGDPDPARRTKTIDNHEKWLDAAAALGCHSIRVNASSGGTFEEQQERTADGLRRLCERGDTRGVNVIVENHGGLSSHGGWLAGVMRRVDHPRCGTLPDFGNFRIRPGEEYNRYEGTRELLPWAKGVSAKSYDFNDAGEETTIDYARMLTIVADGGYRGHVGVEYEGSRLPEREGVLATKALLERVRSSITERAS
ncbi:MAG: sugar phosphate isomerase/epimerase [Phycisphaeraceae bacterium]|nr:MAG: sugar phosphate isomerase/epimerase [Phycisphaeraceae bacterium]